MSSPRDPAALPWPTETCHPPAPISARHVSHSCLHKSPWGPASSAFPALGLPGPWSWLLRVNLPTDHRIHPPRNLRELISQAGSARLSPPSPRLMAVHPTDAAASGLGMHGLRFLNDEWNDSISNGDTFTLRWNQSLPRVGTGLGVFKLAYPKDGVVVYELISNLTDKLDGDLCKWTPSNLERRNLYALWLTAGRDNVNTNWTLSPPWTPRSPAASPLSAPFVIPVICLLGTYALSLTGYLIYRRRRKARREQEDATPHQDATRNNSISSMPSFQTLTEFGDGPEKRSDSLDRDDVVRAISCARRGRGLARNGGRSLSGVDPHDIERALVHVRRGLRDTSEERRPSGMDPQEIERVYSSYRRRRSETTDSRGASTLDRFDFERAQGPFGRGRAGTSDRYGRNGSSVDPTDIELAHRFVGRKRSGPEDPTGIRVVLNSASGSDETIFGDDNESDTTKVDTAGSSADSPIRGRRAQRT